MNILFTLAAPAEYREWVMETLNLSASLLSDVKFPKWQIIYNLKKNKFFH